jgi:hypothetical protein
MNENNSITKKIMNFFILFEEFETNYNKGKLVSYMLRNHKKITNVINSNNQEYDAEIVKNFMSSNFVKNNFSDLADFVKANYEELKKNNYKK